MAANYCEAECPFKPPLRSLPDRLKQGDSPKVVVREMLLAGVASSDVLGTLDDVYLGMSFKENERRKAQAVMGVATLAMSPVTDEVPFPVGNQNPGRGRKQALADIAQWEEHFGST